MKKLLLLTVAAMLGGISVYGQGYIQLANATATAITNTVTGTKASALTVGAFFSPTAADASKTPLAFRDDVTAGGMSTRSLVAPGVISPGAVGFTGTNPGDTVAVQLRAWSNTFSTFADALADTTGTALVGWSQPFQIKLGASTSPALISSVLLPFTVSPVAPVPEPSVLMLGALGLLGLGLIRRK